MSESRGAVRRIVAAVDFSECSRAAVARAVELAGRLDGEVTLLHVVDMSGFYLGDIETGLNLAELSTQLQQVAGADLERLAEAADPERRRIVRTEVREGRAGPAIAAYAQERQADLVVVGTHGRRGLSRLVLGSVAERVVRLAPCDVLVVHAPGEASP